MCGVSDNQAMLDYKGVNPIAHDYMIAVYGVLEQRHVVRNRQRMGRHMNISAGYRKKRREGGFDIVAALCDRAGQYEHSVLCVITAQQLRVASLKCVHMSLKDLSSSALVRMFRAYGIIATALSIDGCAKRENRDDSSDTEQFAFHLDLPVPEVHSFTVTARESPPTAADAGVRSVG
jgi:hypothetical protein